MKVRRVMPDGWLLNESPSGGDSELDEAMLRLFVEAFELWARKQSDYGSENIAQAGQAGVTIRLNDKVQRLRTLLGGEGKALNEPLRDTWLDACVYGAIGLALHDGSWPQAKLAVRSCPTCGGPYAH